MQLGRKWFSFMVVSWAIMELLVIHRLHAQAPTDPMVIDLRSEPARQTTVRFLTDQTVQAKRAAEAVARQRGWPIRGAVTGRMFELMEIVDDRPRYYITVNANAAISTAANLIRNTSPYNVDGTGYTIGIWDGGAVRSTHQELTGRVSIMDGATVIDHATHVAGTLGASGVVAAAMGMAPNIRLDSYDWTSDIAEMTSRAATAPGQAGKIFISNHSYGYLAGWETGNWSGHDGPHFFGVNGEREDRSFGQYSSTAVNWDALHYNAPYYLAFKAAGNDRDDPAPTAGTTYYYYSAGNWHSKAYAPATDPHADGWNQGGYDTTEDDACAKNIMTVGAVNDAVSGGVRVPANGTMSAFSNWGPTDDGRIKPDIVANGVALYSSLGGSDTDYGTYSGTSMAAPNAAGTAILLVDYYGRLFPGQAMRASTLKGLIIHTADDLGTAGPDYAYGWGLMNAEAAANQIQAHAEAPSSLCLHEGLLTTGNPSESFTFVWDGANPIRATMCWTDPAGTAKTGLNDRTAVLVNDLDLRISGPGGTPVYYPYVLNVNSPADAATTGDNIVDNIEQIFIAAPSPGTYTLAISHKRTLSGGQQYYSLILSGQSLNRPPTISHLADQTIAEDSSTGPLSFSVGDVDTPVASLVVTGHSSDLGLIPDSNLVFGGSGANRTVTVTPLTNQNGMATITLTVSDGLSLSNSAFVVTVNPVNDAPVFTKGPDLVVAQGSGAQTRLNWATGISPGPPDEVGQSLSFLLAVDRSYLFEVQPALAANGTLTFTPARLQRGIATISVRLQDDGGLAYGGTNASAPQTFTLSIGLPIDTDSDGMPDDFEVVNGFDPNSAGDANIDSDGDGFTNVQEYQAGTDPHNADDYLRISRTEATESGAMNVSFTTVMGKTYRLERNDNFPVGAWSIVADHVAGTGSVVPVTDTGAVGLSKAVYRVIVLP